MQCPFPQFSPLHHHFNSNSQPYHHFNANSPPNHLFSSNSPPYHNFNANSPLNHHFNAMIPPNHHFYSNLIYSLVAITILTPLPHLMTILTPSSCSLCPPQASVSGYLLFRALIEFPVALHCCLLTTES